MYVIHIKNKLRSGYYYTYLIKEIICSVYNIDLINIKSRRLDLKKHKLVVYAYYAIKRANEICLSTPEITSFKKDLKTKTSTYRTYSYNIFHRSTEGQRETCRVSYKQGLSMSSN